MSFAKRFAHLVKTRRGVEGMTQQELAVAAFGDESAKAQVSKIENARIENPHQKTIDALQVALNLTSEDIEACRAPIAPDIPDSVREEIGLHRNLIETLALRFRHDDPDAPTVELERYLKDKAKEHIALQTRFDELAESENRWANQLAAAKSLINEGQFDEADTILADAEEFQQTEHTLVEVRKQADLRAMRGEAALLRGDPGTAYTHYAKAADMVQPFDLIEAAERRRSYAVALIRYSQRFGGSGFQLGAEMLSLNLTEDIRKLRGAEWSDSQITLGVALQEQGARIPGEDGAVLFAQAVAAHDAALTVRTEADHPLGWAMTQNNLGIALTEQGIRTPGKAGAALITQAVTAFEAALTAYTMAKHPVQWATTQNNLGAALHEQGARTKGETGASLFVQTVTAYEAALTVRTKAHHPTDWAMTQNNLGIALSQQGERSRGEAGLALFGQAIAAFRTALTVRTESDHPLDWALTQHNLGIALKAQGIRTPGDVGDALFAQAVAAYTAALTVRTQAGHAMQWAETQKNIGHAYVAMAERGDSDKRSILEHALTAFDSALTVYDPEHTGYFFEGCTVAREEAAAKLAALDD